MAEPDDLPTRFPTVPGLRVTRMLGEGGMGAVYLAEDQALGRRVAVKVVSDRFTARPSARERFIREARSMATVEHPNVVRVYSFGEVEDRPYFVMEYVEGESLAQRLKRGRLPIAEAVAILRDVVAGLEAAWEKGIVHRDIKPSNILLDGRGLARVADFGLAKPTAEVADASLTASGALLGTPHYLSPEQARADGVDFRSDIYSLGIVLYEMLAGARPFDGSTPFEVVSKHLHQDVPPLRDRRPEVPERLVRLVAGMTAKDPEHRPRSYLELLHGLDAGPASVETLPTNTMRGMARARSRPRRPLLVTAIVLIAAALGYWSWPSKTAVITAPDGRLVVAVAPFYGPDEDSVREGKVTAALVERAIADRLGGGGAKILGVEDTKQAVHDHDAARALGERLGASLVVWGGAYVLRGETEIQPYLTWVPPTRGPGVGKAFNQARRILNADPLDALRERSGTALTVQTQAPNQIGLRKTSAAGIGDLVIVLAGVDALYRQGAAAKALAFFDRAPSNAETLGYRAEALLRLERDDDALRVALEAVALDPKRAEAQARLGDLLVRRERLSDAAAAYRLAEASGRVYSTRDGLVASGRFYVRETFRNWLAKGFPRQDTGYVLQLEQHTGRVLDRLRLPGTIVSFSPGEDGVVIAYQEHDAAPRGRLTLRNGRPDRPLVYGESLLLRRADENSGLAMAANFLDWDRGQFAPHGSIADIPRSFSELETALAHQISRDSTRPWPLFLLGEALWAQGRREEAATTWTRMLETEFGSTPYFEWASMAGRFESLGQREWADRAFERVTRARRQLPQPVLRAPLIERLVAMPATSRAARAIDSGGDLARGHLWLARAREVSATFEGEDFAAAAWEWHFRRSGDAERAKRERDVWRAARSSPLNALQLLARVDYGMNGLAAALLACWLTLGLLIACTWRRAGPANLLSGMRRTDRRALALALLTLVGPAAASGWWTSQTMAMVATPIGLGDSFASVDNLRHLDQRLEAAPTRSGLLVAAVAHHAAGDRDRARELYDELRDEPKVRQNIEALESGRGPAAWPDEGEIFDAYTASSLETLLTAWWGPGNIFEYLGDYLGDDLARFAALSGLFRATLVSGLALLVLSGFRASAPVQAVDRPCPWTYRLVPGAVDVHGGSSTRGYFTLACFCLATVAAAVHLLVSDGLPMVGLLTSASLPSVIKAFPVPALPWWSMFWTWTHAPVYWGTVVLALGASLWLHLRALRATLTRFSTS
jgi:tetratricopeptide (TPR) repeat protein/predicted Ser/Thr protein kinase